MKLSNFFNSVKSLVLYKSHSNVTINKSFFKNNIENLRNVFALYQEYSGKNEIELSGSEWGKDYLALQEILNFIYEFEFDVILHLYRIKDLKNLFKIISSNNLKKHGVRVITVSIYDTDTSSINKDDLSYFANEASKQNIKFHFKFLITGIITKTFTAADYFTLLEPLGQFEVSFERIDAYFDPQIIDPTFPMDLCSISSPCNSRTHLVLCEDGGVFPCIIGTLSPNLKLGDWHINSITNIISTIDCKKYKSLLDHGPSNLVKKQVKEQRTWLDTCHFCRWLNVSKNFNKNLFSYKES